MRTLAIDCATEACSIALFDGGELVAGEYRVLGRGHAEHLVPMIAQLPERGRAGRIAVSLGPGSFTGVRIGLAAARALGLAWKAEVLGYPTLALVAAMARESHPAPVSVCMNGGHGEWFVQDFGAGGMPEGPLVSLAPGEAARAASHEVLAGSRANELAALVGPAATPVAALPDARKFTLIPLALLTSDLAPLYGRPPDARLPEAAA
jgi:tRNA threonylcarbamoyl adenosine modification protein YeaZ